MVNKYAFVLGLVFLLVGVLGFVPTLTPDDKLLGIFAVNPMHNIVHILAGIIGLVGGLSKSPKGGLFFAWFLLVTYGLVTALGFIMTPDHGMLLGMVHINAADNVLHLVLSVSALAILFADRQIPRRV